MKVAIIGCGLNSDYHINFSRAYPGMEIVGVVDRDEQRAKVCKERWGIGKSFESIAELIGFQKPDVIHVVTPPRTHLSLAQESIEAGCHTLIEKPMALSEMDAETMFALAELKGVCVSTMHNHFFDPCMVKARELVESGDVGEIVNVESYYGLNTWIDAFRKYPAPNRLPWLYELPGGVFQDFLAHPLYVVTPFIGRPCEIEVTELALGELPRGLSDELRIVLKGERAFGMVTVSFAARPFQHYVKIYGSRMIVHVNFDTMTTTCRKVSHLPKAAQKATSNLGEGLQLFTGTVENVWNFGTGKLRPYQGMKGLIHKFYDAVQGKGTLPVSREETLLVLGTMDKILGKVRYKHLSYEPILPKKKGQAKNQAPRVLVTGATGFLGQRIVEFLLGKGFRVRSLARKLSKIDRLRAMDTEIYFGDVADPESLSRAMSGVERVVHAAADTSGDEEKGRASTILGTRNVLEIAKASGVKKIVYISSCSVYGVADYREGDRVTEESPLERFPEQRGAYSDAKLKAEEIVREAMETQQLPIVCLRPGTIYGPGGAVFTPMMGFGLGRRVFGIIGDGRFILPLVYIDNLADAVVHVLERDEANGKIYQVVDSDPLDKKAYADRLLKKLYPTARVFYIPYAFLYSAVFAQEILFRALRRRPVLTRYRLVSSQRSVVYDARRIRDDLQWTPPVSTEESLARVIEFERNRKA